MAELFFNAIGHVIWPILEHYLEKHPNVGYIKAFFVSFACVGIPCMLCILLSSNHKDIFKDLWISGVISSLLGLAFGFIAAFSLYSAKRSITKKAKELNQILK